MADIATLKERRDSMIAGLAEYRTRLERMGRKPTAQDRQYITQYEANIREMERLIVEAGGGAGI